MPARLELQTGDLLELQPTATSYILLQSCFYPDQVEIGIPQTIVPERTTFTATVYTRGAGEGVTPTTMHYRVDCLSNKRVLREWTAVSTPAESNEIVISSSDNQILYNRFLYETKQLTVKVDTDLPSQVIKRIEYRVTNLKAIE